MEKDKALEDLRDIKGMMEQSTRFISLSGFSGVFSGLYALVGAWLIWKHVDLTMLEDAMETGVANALSDWYSALTGEEYSYAQSISNLIRISAGMVILSFITGIALTVRKAKKNGQKLFGSSSKRLIANLIVPLVAGGLFLLFIVQREYFDLLAPCTMIFYGLALINASKYTIHDIRFLGLIELTLGFVALLVGGLQAQLVVWAIGFGVMHIVYGIWMYMKYERA